jgi:hypothetical protein
VQGNVRLALSVDPDESVQSETAASRMAICSSTTCPEVVWLPIAATCMLN